MTVDSSDSTWLPCGLRRHTFQFKVSSRMSTTPVVKISWPGITVTGTFHAWFLSKITTGMLSKNSVIVTYHVCNVSIPADANHNSTFIYNRDSLWKRGFNLSPRRQMWLYTIGQNCISGQNPQIYFRTQNSMACHFKVQKDCVRIIFMCLYQVI